MKIQAKDLTKTPPRAPSEKLGGYTILGRSIDKCRALLAGTLGDYHFDCPLDNVLFGFKGIKGDQLKEVVAGGASDQEIVEWLNQNGTRRSPKEIEKFAEDTSNAVWPPEKHGYRDEIIRNANPSLLGKVTKIFETLELDDRASFSKKPVGVQ